MKNNGWHSLSKEGKEMASGKSSFSFCLKYFGFSAYAKFFHELCYLFHLILAGEGRMNIYSCRTCGLCCPLCTQVSTWNHSDRTWALEGLFSATWGLMEILAWRKCRSSTEKDQCSRVLRSRVLLCLFPDFLVWAPMQIIALKRWREPWLCFLFFPTFHF